MKKFLIIQTAFIGDVVLATCLVEKLHRFFPDSQIDFLLRKGNESLLQGHPHITQIWIWNKKKEKLRNLLRLLKRIRKERYDKVINVQRFAATGWITALSGAQETIGFRKNPLSWMFTRRIPHEIGPEGQTIHEIQRDLRLIQEFTDASQELPALYPSSEDMKKVSAYQDRVYVTISPASIWYTKQYPAGQWVSFIRKIPPAYRIFLLGAAADHALADSISQQSERPNLDNLCGTLSYLQSAALMKGAAMNYVNDSAPLHFASAMNAAVTAVFCSTVPAFGFGPLSKEHFIVEVQEKLDCRPCGLHGYASCPLGHFKCAREIQDEQLMRSIPS